MKSPFFSARWATICCPVSHLLGPLLYHYTFEGPDVHNIACSTPSHENEIEKYHDLGLKLRDFELFCVKNWFGCSFDKLKNVP